MVKLLPLVLLQIVLAATSEAAPTFKRDILSKNFSTFKKISLTTEQCSEIESRLGQLFYVSVDGVGAETLNRSIHPLYIDMVKDLNIGGVLPHTAAFHDSAREDIKKLKEAANSPLLVGIDKVQISFGACKTKCWATDDLGFGFDLGLLRTTARVSSFCRAAYFWYQSKVHSFMGINNPLGPTTEVHQGSPLLSSQEVAKKNTPHLRALVDLIASENLIPTGKHFPFIPLTFNLHHQNADQKAEKKDVLARTQVFKDLGNSLPIVMTTHVLNSKIDSENMVTFSKAWIDLLRTELGYTGLILTDGLFMISNYPDSVNQMEKEWPKTGFGEFKTSPGTRFTVRALLAGHDMVFLEGSRKDTYQVFREVLLLSCQKGKPSEALRERILDSFSRIQHFKTQNQERLLGRDESLTAEEMAKLADLHRSDLKKSRLGHFVYTETCETERDRYVQTMKKFGAPISKFETIPKAYVERELLERMGWSVTE